MRVRGCQKLASTNATYTPPSSSAKRRKIDTAEDVPPLADTLDRLQQHTAAANPFLESTVRKWSDKVNAASTASLKNKNKFSGGGANSAIFKNTWSAIEGALAADEGRLVERTKTLRSGTEAIGGGEPRTVFDDADFYQQLLRDVVDHQLLDPDDPSMRALQAAAQAKKPKKLVDTKASKGRKLRCVAARQRASERASLSDDRSLDLAGITCTRSCKTSWCRWRRPPGASSRPMSCLEVYWAKDLRGIYKMESNSSRRKKKPSVQRRRWTAGIWPVCGSLGECIT